MGPSFCPVEVTNLDAMIAFTAANGWHLLPTPELLQALGPRRRKRKTPYRFNEEWTRALNLAAGYSPEHVDRIVRSALSVEETHEHTLGRRHSRRRYLEG